MTGLDGVYALVDCDNTFFLGRKDHAVAYVDSDPTDPASAIVERDRWYKPDHIEGFFVGINITFDGWLVMTTDHGWVVLSATSASTGRSRSGRAQDAAGPLRGESRGLRPHRFRLGAHQHVCRRRQQHLPVLVTTTTRWSGMANG